MRRNPNPIRLAPALSAAVLSFVLASPLAAEPTELFGEPSKVEKFGDWVAGCVREDAKEGAFYCAGVALIPEGADPATKPIVMRLSRSRWRFPRIETHLPDRGNEEYLIKLDGRTVYRGKADDKGGIDLSATEYDNGGLRRDKSTDRLFDGIARGNRLTIEGAGGELLGSVSLRGSTAAMRWMDGKQKRSGYANAFFYRGTKLNRYVKMRPLAVAKLPLARNPKSADLPDLETIVGLLSPESCGDGREMGADHSISALREKFGDYALILVDCGKEGDDQLAKAYIASRPDKSSNWTLEPARYGKGYVSDIKVELPLLYNPSFEGRARRGYLESKRLIDGRKDCGIRVKYYIYSGEEIRPPSRYEMPVCGGDTKWIGVDLD